MNTFKKVVEEKEVIESVICDICGNPCYNEWGLNGIDIKTYWGYDSKKDLEFWTAQICESCVDEKLVPLINFKKEMYNPVTGSTSPLPNNEPEVAEGGNGASQQQPNSSTDDGNQNPSQLKEATILSAEQFIEKKIRSINPDWDYGKDFNEVWRQFWMLFDPQPAMNIIVAAMEEYKNQEVQLLNK